MIAFTMLNDVDVYAVQISLDVPTIDVLGKYLSLGEKRCESESEREGWREEVDEKGCRQNSFDEQVQNITHNCFGNSHIILVSQNGSLGNSCKDSGGHYNPNQKNHGSLNAAERHEGDFGNIVADNQGVATISVARWVVLLSTLTAGRNDFLWRLHKALVK